MEFLAFANPLEPVIHALTTIIVFIDGYVHNLGWSLILLALLIRLAFWPLVTMQYKSMAEMQQIQPMVKALQAKLKSDPQKMNQEVMALYKEHNVNPFASCLPLLVQLPILFSLYWAIIAEKETFTKESWGWIGSPLSLNSPQIFGIHVLAPSLAQPDLILLALYIISMYFSVKFGSPPSPDPAQAQQQKIMAFMSPVFIAWFGRTWPSALILYWFSINIFTMAQQVFLMRRFRAKLAAKAAAAENAPKDVTPRKGANAALAAADDGTAAATRNGASRKNRSRKGA